MGTSYPKDPEGPICPCFGLMVSDIVDDARVGSKDRIRNLATQAQGPKARCLEKCPDGATCVPRVLRLFRETFDAREA
jgi:hypothetical protein